MANALVTGANGRIGHSLLPALKVKGYKVLALDIDELMPELVADEKIVGNVLDQKLLADIMSKGIDMVFHLASTLVITSELDPQNAHKTNATGTVNIYSAALSYSEKSGKPVQVIFPSSISVYRMPDVKTKEASVITEEEYIGDPQTIYGITKLYCEQLGSYYSDRYKMLDDRKKGQIDFRALRLPGIITQFTSDTDLGKYAGLTMIHSPAESGGYEVYVKETTTLPFITMEDAVSALIGLAEAPREKLTRRVYNVSGFAASVSELSGMIKKEIPESSVSDNYDERRQAIVDTWPQAIDDSKAREDWGWKPSKNSL